MRGKNVYWKAGMTVFFTTAALLLFYDTLFGSRTALKLLNKLTGALTPILYGAAMAYLLAPTIDFWERHFFPHQVQRAREEGRLCASGPRAVSLALTWCLIAVGAWLLLRVLLPELYRSVVQLIGNVETYYYTISGWVQDLLESNPTVEQWVIAQMNEYYDGITKWLRTELLPQTKTVMFAVSGGIWQVVLFVSDLVVGIIVSVYLMATKERVAAHCRKLVHGFAPRTWVKWIFRGVHRVDRIFSGFVRGKLLDSLIIGIICFICCSLLDFPYTPLVSLIVGVTNVIPFFGPYLGAVPSTILILLASPIQALYFVIFILILQQIDGNIIGPKILGDTTGLSSLWVIIAILVGGGFFGVKGMFFGVPVCACLYSFVSFLTRRALKERGMPAETAAYLVDFPAADGGGEKKT